MNLGRWEAAREHLERATRLNPRLVTSTQLLGNVLLSTRRYPDAERAYDRALELEPSNLGVREGRARVALARGDLAGARAVFQGTPKEVDPTSLVAYIASSQELNWLLDEDQQRLLLRLTPSAFDDDRGTWGLALAQIYALRGNAAKARVYADSARLAYEQQLQATPQHDRRRVSLGLALAYLGDRSAAIREGQRAVANSPIIADAASGQLHQLIRIYLVTGQSEKALDHLESLLEIPHHLSPGWLKIDPTFDSLRGNPRFQRLVNAKP
jgi:serine/threonine-protein kinase